MSSQLGYSLHDDAAREVITYDADGKEIGRLPYTPEENARADEAAARALAESNKSTVELNMESDLAAMQGIIGQTNAALRDDPSQEIKAMARAIRRLERMALSDFSGTE